VAGLPLAGKEQHRFAVLVLHPVQVLAFEGRDVVADLPGGVGVELQANTVGRLLDRVRRCPALHQSSDFCVVMGQQHVALGEGEDEQRVFRHMRPVDEVIDDEVVGLERKNLAHHLDVSLDGIGHPFHLRDVAEIAE
jgi:hypothetical protein